jgi:hypothetical protein
MLVEEARKGNEYRRLERKGKASKRKSARELLEKLCTKATRKKGESEQEKAARKQRKKGTIERK